MHEQTQQPVAAASAESTELFHLIIENITDYAIFMTDPEGRVKSWNPGVERLLGYTENEIVGQPISVIFTEEDVAEGAHRAEMERAAREGRAEDKRWHRRRDGSLFYANGMVMPLHNANGTLRGFAKVMRDDTAHKLAEDKLEETNRRVSNIFESITDAFLALDHDWRIVRVNHNFELLVNRKREELIGKNFWEEFPEINGSTFEQHYRRAVREGAIIAFEEYYARLDRWVEARAYPSIDGLAIYFHDITERKRAEQIINQSEEQFRLLVTASSDTLYKLSADWSEMRSLQGRNFLADTEDPNRNWLEVYIPAPDQPLVLAAIRKAIQNKSTFELEHRVYRADGTIGWTFSRAIPMLDTDGEIIEWFGAAADITTRKEAEAMRELSLENEQAARSQAEEANRFKDEFLATVSHELRTPLNAILGWSSLLLSKSLDEAAAAKALETINRNARSQNQIIEDILDVSRIITGKLRLDVQLVQPSKVIEAAVDSLVHAAEAKNVRLQVLLDPSAGAVSGDPDRLQQILWNLVSNAIKFTPKGGRVEVRLERVDAHVEIVVSDTGQGIEPAFLSEVFDRFRQADSSSKRSFGGLGLGLSIVKQLVEMHGGNVKAESPGLGQGATFTVSLPAAVVHNPKSTNLEEPVHPAKSAARIAFDCPPVLRGLRILAVDDEKDSRDLLKNVLSRCQAEVLIVSSAAEALGSFTEFQPDVLVSDIGMPETDGYELIQEIRKMEKANDSRRVPAVALTAYARVEDRMKALSAGFQMHVPKPIEPAELATVITSLVA